MRGVLPALFEPPVQFLNQEVHMEKELERELGIMPA